MINEHDDAERVVLDDVSCCAAEDRVYLLEVSAVCSCILAAAMDKVAQACGALHDDGGHEQ